MSAVKTAFSGTGVDPRQITPATSEKCRSLDQSGVVGRCESGARSGVELISSRLIFTIGEGRQRFGIQQFDSIIATGDPACRFE